MVKEEIVEGIKLAMSKGESMEKAMMSFYNAGYSKEDIEEAASLVNAPKTQAFPQLSAKKTQVSSFGTLTQLSNLIQTQKEPSSQAQSTPQKNPQIQAEKQLSNQQPSSQQKTNQKFSDYSPRKGLSKTITIILFALLFLLIAALVLVFLFKNQISTILNSFFG